MAWSADAVHGAGNVKTGTNRKTARPGKGGHLCVHCRLPGGGGGATESRFAVGRKKGEEKGPEKGKLDSIKAVGVQFEGGPYAATG